MRLFICTLITLFSSATFANDLVIDAGKPGAVYVEPHTTEPQIDMLKRQLEYRERRLELRQILEERQDHFAAPRRQIHADYTANLDALKRTDFRGETQ